MSVESIDSIPNPRIVWRFSLGIVILATVIGLLSLFPFWDALVRMWDIWFVYPEYSYSLLIPPIAAFLIWQQKDRLELLTFDGSWAGALWVCGGTVLLVLGQMGTIYVLVQYGYLLTLFGLTLAWMGARPFRLILFPLLILLFMIPLPDFMIHNLSADLQLISSQLGVGFIRLMGISVFLEGNVIDLGTYKLQVAEACNGLRYLFPLMTIGFLMAYFYKGAAWKRIVLFLSSIPITIIMNSLRIGVIGVMVEHWGIGMAEGFLHEFQGWVVFMACAALMLGEIVVLNRVGRESGTWRQLFGIEFPAPTPQGAIKKKRSVPSSFIAACVLLVATIAASQWLPRPVEIIPSRGALIDFPMNLGPWRGRPETMEGVYLDVLKLDDYVLADYASSGGGPPVNLYIAYYGSQRKGEAVHSPRSCLPGGGWQFRDFNQRSLPLKIDGRPLRVNRTIIEMADQRQLVYYWFQQRGRVITNEFAVKWYLFWDALSRHRTDGALVRLTTPLPPGGSAEEADRRLIDVAARIAPVLHRYIPD